MRREGALTLCSHLRRGVLWRSTGKKGASLGYRDPTLQHNEKAGGRFAGRLPDSTLSVCYSWIERINAMMELMSSSVRKSNPPFGGMATPVVLRGSSASRPSST